MVESGRQAFDPTDARSLIAQADDERQRKAYMARRRQEMLEKTKDVVDAARAAKGAEEEEEKTFFSLC